MLLDEGKLSEPVGVVVLRGLWFGSWTRDIGECIHSFIHIAHLYSASSRELLRGAPDSSTAKKRSLKLRKKRR